MDYTHTEALEQGKRLKEIFLKSKKVPYRNMKREKVAAIAILRTGGHEEVVIIGESKINTYKTKIFCEPYEFRIESNLSPIEPVNPKNTKKSAFLYSQKTIEIDVFERETNKRRMQKGVYEISIKEQENLEIKVLKIVSKDDEVIPLDQKQLEEIMMRVKVIKRSK